MEPSCATTMPRGSRRDAGAANAAVPMARRRMQPAATVLLMSVTARSGSRDHADGLQVGSPGKERCEYRIARSPEQEGIRLVRGCAETGPCFRCLSQRGEHNGIMHPRLSPPGSNGHLRQRTPRLLRAPRLLVNVPEVREGPVRALQLTAARKARLRGPEISLLYLGAPHEEVRDPVLLDLLDGAPALLDRPV